MNYQGIKEYLRRHPDFFLDEKNRATSWHDFVKWPSHPVDRDHLIMPGEMYMVDAVNAKQSGSFWIVQLQRNGGQKLIFKLADDMRESFGRVVNGYWVIPDYE